MLPPRVAGSHASMPALVPPLAATQAQLLPHSCRGGHCIKNHVAYTKVLGKHTAEMVLVHFKNDAIKGPQHIPLSPLLLEMMVLLEQAVHAIFPTSATVFCMENGRPYQLAYFSTVVGDYLTFDGVRTTANHWRHVFTTLWRDFLSSPTTKLLDFTVQQLEEGAAQLMLNSTQAWNAAYDDTDKLRAILHTQALWPKFREFVHNVHTAKMSEEPWNPLAIHHDALVL